MIQLKADQVAKILAECPATVCKALEKPFVLVIKTNNGVSVSYQNASEQKTTCTGSTILTGDMLITAALNVKFKKDKHYILLVVSNPHSNETGSCFYLIGETKSGEDESTAFFAYEAEKNRSVNVVSIIEDAQDKSIFTDARRYGKDSEKLLRNQLRMFMALAGVSSPIRNRIITGGGFLPPTGAVAVPEVENE